MAITDKFNNTKTTVNPVVTTVSTARSIGTTSLVCTDLTGWPTTVHFVTYKKTATGTIDKTTQCEWKGIVAGSTIGTLTLKSGTDAGNAIGDFVEMGPTASWGKDLIDGVTAQHNQDGTHAAITATSVTNSGNYSQSAGTFTVPNEVISWSGLKASTMSLNMKSAVNSSSPTLINGDQDLASCGVAITFTVASNCNAMVTVSLGITSTSDFEFKPEIRLDGAVYQTFNPAAAVTNAVGRANVRGFTYVVPLTTGARTLSAGVSLSSATGQTMQIGAGSIAAIVLGRVTA